MITREKLLEEAASWLGTPYHLGGQVKGAGCDCATFIYCVYHACGLIGRQELGVFAADFASVLTEEVYILRLIKIARKTVEGVTYPTLKARPGNIALTKTDERARINNHGGIVKAWPWIYHCVPDGGVALVDATKNFLWSFKPVMVFDPWEGPNGTSQGTGRAEANGAGHDAAGVDVRGDHPDDLRANALPTAGDLGR